MKEPPHPCLAQGKARYVGDHVAMVIAETHQQARDAAELVKVDYEELPPWCAPAKPARKARRWCTTSRLTTPATSGASATSGGGQGLRRRRARHHARIPE